MRWWPLTGTGVWSQASPHLPLGLESLPCQPCGGGGQELTVREHDRHALLPDLVEVRRNCELRSCRLCWWGPRAHREGPGDSRLVHIFVPAIRRWLQHCHLLAPQRRVPGELAPLLLPRSISVEGEDQLTHLPRPLPTSALHAEDRHHAWHTRGQQRYRRPGRSTAAWHRPTARHSRHIELGLDLAGGIQVSETAWLGWWRL